VTLPTGPCKKLNADLYANAHIKTHANSGVNHPQCCDILHSAIALANNQHHCCSGNKARSCGECVDGCMDTLSIDEKVVEPKGLHIAARDSNPILEISHYSK